MSSPRDPSVPGRPRPHPLHGVVVLVLVVCGACTSPVRDELPTTASVGVGTFTESRAGAEAGDLDADGYRVQFGDSLRTMGVNDTWTVRGLESGTYTVRVDDIQENCRVDAPGNPLSFTVDPSRDNGNIEFRLSCDPRVGTLTVQTTFTGSAPDPDGYSVVVDGQAVGVIGVNEGINYPGVAVGIRTVELRGLASNCVVQGQNPRTAEVIYGQQVFVPFDVDCPAPGTCSLDAPRAWYPFQNGSGQDVTGNGFSGMVDGATTVPDRTGTPDQALAFDGTASVELGDVFNSLSPPYTLTAWVRQPSPARDGFRTIFVTDDTPGSYFGTWFQVAPTGQLEITYGNGGAPGLASRRSALSDAPLPTDAWVHLAAVVAGPDDMRLYVDGTSAAATLSGTGGPLAHSDGPARIGAATIVPENQGWSGELDEVRVYGCALEGGQVAELAGSQARAAGRRAITEPTRPRPVLTPVPEGPQSR